MHLFVQIHKSSASMEWISGLNEAVDHGSHTIVVLAEDGLEHCKVEVSHLEDDLVENVQVGCSVWVLVDVKEWSLKRFHDHIISVDDLLWQNHRELVNFLVVCEPQIFELK